MNKVPTIVMKYKYISKHHNIDYKTLLMTSLHMAQISSDHQTQASS